MEVELVGETRMGRTEVCVGKVEMNAPLNDRVRVRKKTLEAVLMQCQRALEMLNTTGDFDNYDDDDDYDGAGGTATCSDEIGESSSDVSGDRETNELQLCDLLKSRVECDDFLEKIGKAQAAIPQNLTEESSSWDMISEKDLWEGELTELDKEDYVLVRQEDIVEGIACFMAAYLLSLKQTKDLTPNQLQEALSKTFSSKKKKGKLRKAWDGSKVIYNVASWGATAIGIYQNPAILQAATAAFWTSCRVISKFF